MPASPVFSSIGSASSSVRTMMVGPSPFLKSATSPVLRFELPDFYSGATDRIDRFTEGFLLRRLQIYIEPKAVVFWALGDGSIHLGAAHPDTGLKAESSLTIGTYQGTKVQIGGSVEESGPNATHVWSGRLQFSVPLK